MSAPYAYAMEQAMATLMAARARLLADDPDLDPDGDVIQDVLCDVTADAMGMLDATLRAALEARDMAEMADIRAKAIAARRDRYKARSEALKGAAFAAMDALGMKRRELPEMTVTIAAGRPAVVILDAET